MQAQLLQGCIKVMLRRQRKAVDTTGAFLAQVNFINWLFYTSDAADEQARLNFFVCSSPKHTHMGLPYLAT